MPRCEAWWSCRSSSRSKTGCGCTILPTPRRCKSRSASTRPSPPRTAFTAFWRCQVATTWYRRPTRTRTARAQCGYGTPHQHFYYPAKFYHPEGHCIIDDAFMWILWITPPSAGLTVLSSQPGVKPRSLHAFFFPSRWIRSWRLMIAMPQQCASTGRKRVIRQPSWPQRTGTATIQTLAITNRMCLYLS